MEPAALAITGFSLLIALTLAFYSLQETRNRRRTWTALDHLAAARGLALARSRDSAYAFPEATGTLDGRLVRLVGRAQTRYTPAYLEVVVACNLAEAKGLRVLSPKLAGKGRLWTGYERAWVESGVAGYRTLVVAFHKGVVERFLALAGPAGRGLLIDWTLRPDFVSAHFERDALVVALSVHTLEGATVGEVLDGALELATILDQGRPPHPLQAAHAPLRGHPTGGVGRALLWTAAAPSLALGAFMIVSSTQMADDNSAAVVFGAGVLLSSLSAAVLPMLRGGRAARAAMGRRG